VGCVERKSVTPKKASFRSKLAFCLFIKGEKGTEKLSLYSLSCSAVLSPRLVQHMRREPPRGCIRFSRRGTKAGGSRCLRRGTKAGAERYPLFPIPYLVSENSASITSSAPPLGALPVAPPSGGVPAPPSSPPPVAPAC
jgi:hypothetical protein